jgi:hypothetical protein
MEKLAGSKENLGQASDFLAALGQHRHGALEGFFRSL